ncbi:helix-turn-helix domain-containing protein [Paenibacillus sp. CAU 1782]
MAKKPTYPAIDLKNDQYTHPSGILISDYYNQPYGYTCYRPEGTKDWLIMYTLSGKGSVNNGCKGYLTCAEGTITLISPGTLQDFFTEEGHNWELLWAHFIPRLTWMDWLPSSNTEGPIFHLSIEDDKTRNVLEKAFRRVLSYRLDDNALLQDELTLNALEEIILLIASRNHRLKELDPRIKEVLDILSQHYTEDHNVQDLANRVCLSPSRLSHLFKEQVGDSIIETLMKYKLKQAEKLLQYTLRPITEIALGVGFNSPDYFSRQFASYYGVSPSQYRKRLRGGIQ